MRRLGILLKLLYFLRIPVLGGLALLALAALGGSSQTTITNMMIMERPFQLFISTFLAAAVAAECGLVALLIWSLGPTRFDTALPALPGGLRSRSSLRGLYCLPLAFPLIGRLWWRNAFDGRGLPIRDSDLGVGESTLAVLLGLAAAGLLLAVIEGLRDLLVRSTEPVVPAQAGVVRQVAASLSPFLRRQWLFRTLSNLARFFGPGYYEEREDGSGEVAPGHAGAMVMVTILGLLYFYFYWRLDPSRGSHDLTPTLAYILGLLLLLVSILSFATFVLDRFRMPLLAGLVLWVIALGAFAPKEHYFVVKEGSAPPALQEAAARRLEVQRRELPPDRPPLLTVVVSSGGGIQAAAWTARVLTELQGKIGEGFTRSIYLISSVSGGSVGTVYYLESFDPLIGSPRPAALARIREAAQRSSLEATAWGLVFPDVMRVFLPVADKRRDRAWAMEQAWLRTAKGQGPRDPTRGLAGTSSPLTRRTAMLSDWRRGAAEGWLPAAVLNTTVVEDGQQLWVSSVDLSGSIASRTNGVGHTLEERYGQPLDLPVVTAARLSAAFPYVTPVARATWDEAREEGEGDERAALDGAHLGDGGYFDNFGVVAALEWLLQLSSPAGGEPPLLEAFEKVLFVEISAFGPASPQTAPCRGREPCGGKGGEEAVRNGKKGWELAFTGPLKTLLNVRTSSQRSRNELELELARRVLRDKLADPFVFRPPARREGEEHPSLLDGCAELPFRNPPVSWHLSRTDVKTVECDWHSAANQGEANRLKGYFDGIGGGA